MDKNDQLIRLSEVGRFWRVGFDALSYPEQVFYVIWELESEVNNGGFEQFFSNSSGDVAFAVVDALKAIGAEETARIAAEANGMFPGSFPPRDRDERQALLETFDAEKIEAWDKLDQEFYKRPDNLTELLHEYVRRNASKIAGAGDVVE